MTSNRDRYGLPPRLFLYTEDQIADMLQLPDTTKILHYEGRSVGVPRRDRMLARNIAPDGEKPEWRVDEAEFIRWMRHNNMLPMLRVR